MEWTEIDDDLWTLPGAKTKNRRVHAVPLSEMAIELLEKQRPLHDTWVFPSPKGLDQPISNLGKALRGTNGSKKPGRNIRGKSGVKDFRAHDLRRTFSTGLTRLGFSRFIVDRLLNHSDSGIGRVYDRHDYLKEKTEAAEAWGRHIEGIIGDATKVVQMVQPEAS